MWYTTSAVLLQKPLEERILIGFLPEGYPFGHLFTYLKVTVYNEVFTSKFHAKVFHDKFQSARRGEMISETDHNDQICRKNLKLPPPTG